MKAGDRGCFPHPTDLRRQWAAVVEGHRDRVALKVGATSVTYGEMAGRVEAWVRAFDELRGGGPRGVGVLGEPSVAVIEIQLAVLLSGNFHFFLDSREAGNISREVLEAAQLAVIVDCREDGRDPLPFAEGVCPVVRWDQPGRLAGSVTAASGAVLPEEGGALFLTSGSSGVPKMVLFPVKALLADIARQTETLGLGREDVLDLLFSPSFSASLASIYDALLNGGTLCVADLKRMGVDRLRAWLEANEVTVCTIGVGTLRAWLRTWSGAAPLPRLRLVSTGGEILYWDDVARFRECLGTGCVLQNAYASTETRTSAEFFIRGGDPLEQGPVPVGNAVRGRRLRLLGPDGAEAVREGELGVECELGPSGYFNGADPGAFERLSDGWQRFRTRDWARMDAAGRLHILGRADDVIKLRGQRVALGEVVQTVRAAFPESEAQAEFVGEELVLVMPRPTETDGPSEEQILGAFPNRLRPHRVLFPDTLPRTHTGKPDRPELRRWIERERASARSVTDRSTVEGRVVGVLCAVTGRREVARDVDLFRGLGLDSLRGAEVLVALEKEFGQRLPEQLLVEHPTVAGVVGWLEDPKHEPRYRWTVRKGGGSRRFIFVASKPAHPGLTNALVPLLDDGWEVVTLDFPALRLPPSEWLSMREVGVALAAEVMARDDARPLWLGGYCLGGLAAYGMAVELERRGRAVERVVLMSTSTYAQRRSRLSRVWSLIRRIRWRHVVELVGKRGLNRIQRRVRARVDLPLPAETTSAVAADVGAADVLRLDPGMTHLMHAYAPEPFVGRVTLLNPGVEEPALAELSNFVLEDGWERYVTGPVERWSVPGATHGTMAVEKIEVTAGVFAEVMGKWG
jgi:acyl-CoA synthetase (AMP-forming)/AMP-acid ligase II/thioesterase domain-containing protein/acyl carrier protein